MVTVNDELLQSNGKKYRRIVSLSIPFVCEGTKKRISNSIVHDTVKLFLTNLVQTVFGGTSYVHHGI